MASVDVQLALGAQDTRDRGREPVLATKLSLSQMLNTAFTFSDTLVPAV